MSSRRSSARSKFNANTSSGCSASWPSRRRCWRTGATRPPASPAKTATGARWRSIRLAGTQSYEQAQYNAAQAQQAQQNIAVANLQVAQLAGYAQQMQNFEGFCNCVPSRAQVWGAQHGLVQQLNDNTVKE